MKLQNVVNKLDKDENIDKQYKEFVKEFRNIPGNTKITYDYETYKDLVLDKINNEEASTSNDSFLKVFSIFEIDRNFLVNDIIKFFISIKLLYENMSKVYWTLYFKMDVHYKDDVLIKSFKKQMTSKRFLFKNLATYNIDNMFKLNKDTDRLIFRLYMYKLSTAYKNNVTVTLTNSLEENYCNLIWYRNQ